MASIPDPPDEPRRPSRSGVLEVYKASPTDWDRFDIARADAMARFVAVLVRDTMLVGEQERQIEGLMTVVDELDREVHETANEVHSLEGLIELGEEQRGPLREVRRAYA